MEALDLYRKCLYEQETLVALAKEAEEEAEIETEEGDFNKADDEMKIDIDQSLKEQLESTSLGNQHETEVSATVIDPTTEDDLVDTALAKLSALTLLCTLHDCSPTTDASSNPSLDSLESLAYELTDSGILSLQDKSQSSPESTVQRRTSEVLLARAAFVAAVAAAHYRAHRIDALAFQTLIHDAYERIPDGNNAGDVLCAYADALSDFDITLSNSPVFTVVTDAASLTTSETIPLFRWRALSTAQDRLARAAALPTAGDDPLRQCRVYTLKAELELRRLRLVQETPRAPENEALPVEVRKTGPTLARNAATFYRGAAKWARQGRMVEEERETAVKACVAEWVWVLRVETEGVVIGKKLRELAGKLREAAGAWTNRTEKVEEVLKEMVEERLVEPDVTEALGKIVLGL